MTQSQQLHSNNAQHVRRIVKHGAHVLLACILVAFLYITLQLWQLQQAVDERNISKIHTATQNLLPFARLIAPKALGDNFVLAPLRLIPEIAIYSTQIATQLPSLFAQQTTGTIDFRPVKDQLKKLEEHTTALTNNLEKNPRTLQALERIYPDAATSAKSVSTTLAAINQLIDTDGHVLLLLQNTDELRATGGFMGSYVLITLKDAQVSEWVVEDIYDADGQFTGYLEAPPGVKEYLSDNRGLRLPDANWDPDFPTSAQHILQFFALGNRLNIHTVATINLTLAERSMSILGPIKLPDYATEISADNIGTALRSERAEFFAGSIQKKHLLEQLLVQVQLRAASLSNQQLLELAQVFRSAVVLREIQVFASNSQLQESLQQLQMTGELTTVPQTNPIFLIESNVGINKANREISRAITISKHTQQITVDLTIQNNNTPSDVQLQTGSSVRDSVYSNFQRLFVLPGWELDSVSIDGTTTTPQSTRTVTTYAGTELTEYGMLVQVPEQTSTTVRFLVHTENTELARYPVIFTPQSGTSPSNTSITITN